MHGHFRARMAWLHGWAGLLLGWLLFAVCLTGSAAYYRDELSLWMRPELHAAIHQADAQARVRPITPEEATTTAQRLLQHEAPQADTWVIDLPHARQPLLALHWTDPAHGRILTPAAGRVGGQFRSHWADPRSGAFAPEARSTQGGDFLYQFHFTLHYLPARWGRWIVGAAAMAMLVALVSGVVTHRRFFADFFTFRPRKGSRSWLDAHNVLGVVALPYHLVLVFSGLVTLMFLLQPWGLQAVYGADRGSFFGAVLPQAPGLVEASGRTAPLVPIAPLLAQARTHWAGATAGRIIVHRPGDAHARVVLEQAEAGRMTQLRPALHFDGTTGALLQARGSEYGAASATRGVLYALHQARFADHGLRALLFLSGLLCSAAVATGLLLWSAKRRPTSGMGVVRALNIAAIAGLPLALAAHLTANRWLPPSLPGRAALEIDAFFAAWATATALAALWPTRALWRAQFGMAAMLFAALPLGPGMGLMPTDRIGTMGLAWWTVAGALGALVWRVGSSTQPIKKKSC